MKGISENRLELKRWKKPIDFWLSECYLEEFLRAIEVQEGNTLIWVSSDY